MRKLSGVSETAFLQVLWWSSLFICILSGLFKDVYMMIFGIILNINFFLFLTFMVIKK